MRSIITVDNVSKQYRLGGVGTGTIKDDLTRWWYRLRGKEDPFLRIGETNDRSQKGSSDYVWALRDINFEVQPGEVLGIIGRNGAGKSTLLKILSRVAEPTTGRVTMHGRVASLLEVGTGMHPELTGRENIYLNGAILGMRKAEIDRKLDEIIDFSGVERYIDTPVKRYSSGMHVRLGFAVAAHLEPEILIVDEVLAVGDAEFQKKCLGKMKEVSASEGRTVLFVSHNIDAIQKLCPKSMLLDCGELLELNTTSNVLEKYLKRRIQNHFDRDAPQQQPIAITAVDTSVDTGCIEEFLQLDIEVTSKIKEQVSIDLRISNAIGAPVAFASLGTLNYEHLVQIEPGINVFNLELSTSGMAIGDYMLSIDITKPNVAYYDRVEDCVSFELIKSNADDRRLLQSWNYGSFQLDVKLLKPTNSLA